MPSLLTSLVNYDQTLDGTVVSAFKCSVRHPGLITDTNIAAAIVSKLIQGVNYDDPGLDIARNQSTYKVTPLTGASVAIPNDAEFYHIVPAGTIAALTVAMPPAPYDGQEVTITTDQIVTALTHTAPSGTLKGALTAGTAKGFGRWKYNLTDTTWYRIG